MWQLMVAELVLNRLQMIDSFRWLREEEETQQDRDLQQAYADLMGWGINSE